MASQNSDWLARLWGGGGEAVATFIVTTGTVREFVWRRAPDLIVVRHEYGVRSDCAGDDATVGFTAVNDAVAKGEHAIDPPAAARSDRKFL